MNTVLEKADMLPVAVEDGDQRVRTRKEIGKAGWSQIMKDVVKKFRIFPVGEEKLWMFLSRREISSIVLWKVIQIAMFKMAGEGDKGTSLKSITIIK